ncbi:M20 metallopeptidase family protein [Helicovermis profundi]|uniref:M20 family metallopeptidase n=1 Tax=Helicovermis profundi TaxID=3065157 RepID=A0AAU9EMY2_9FIRM|nr:M20 family metallopeptidase [Clostridia bacterium S502]
MDIKKMIDEIYDEIIEIRRFIHMNPELSNQEYNTNKKIVNFLNSNNIENRTIANTGVLGIISGISNSEKTIALRADIDALPLEEKTDLPFKSISKNVMHACGHDVHTAILLGSAKILNNLKDKFSGNVKLFFQPAEETTGGALPMIEENCLKSPKVDYVLGLHVMPYLKTGKIELKYGKLNAASDTIKIIVSGKSGHGAYPETSIDAILIASHIIVSMQTLISRNISPLNSAVLSFGTINGGSKTNIIADEVILSGTLRTLDSKTREFTHKKIREIAEYTAKAFGGDSKVIIENGYEPLINNDEVVKVLYNTAIENIGEENIVFKDFPSLGVEDFSYFSNRVPGAFFHLGCKKENLSTSLHNNNFDVDENCIKTGILMQVKTALNLLQS